MKATQNQYDENLNNARNNKNPRFFSYFIVFHLKNTSSGYTSRGLGLYMCYFDDHVCFSSPTNKSISKKLKKQPALLNTLQTTQPSCENWLTAADIQTGVQWLRTGRINDWKRRDRKRRTISAHVPSFFQDIYPTRCLSLNRHYYASQKWI